jgi:hypothetical protein
MIEVDPEAVLELLDARDYYEQRRLGFGAIFELVAQRTIDAIVAAPGRYPPHPFATTPGVRRALFLRPPRFPFAFAYLLRGATGHPYVLAAEHLRKEPAYWAGRLEGRPTKGG